MGGLLPTEYLWEQTSNEHTRLPDNYYGADPAPLATGRPGWIAPWSDASDANAQALRYAHGIAHVVPYYAQVPMPPATDRGKLELALQVPNPTDPTASGTPPEYSYNGDAVFGTDFHTSGGVAEVAPTLSPGVVGEVAGGPLRIDAWVLDASTHHKFAANLSGDMRLALRHFQTWWQHAGDVALHAPRTRNGNVAIPAPVVHVPRTGSRGRGGAPDLADARARCTRAPRAKPRKRPRWGALRRRPRSTTTTR